MTDIMKRFTVYIEPAPTQQSALRILKNKAGKMFVGKMANSKATKWKKEFISKVLKEKPEKPYDFPLFVEITFEYPFLKKHKGETDVLPKTTRPDLDNLEKMVLDGLVEAGFMVDDSYICSKYTHKLFSTTAPRISIDISRCSW